MGKIILFSVGCPQCHVLKKKLELAGIEFELCDDLEEIEKRGYLVVPILEIDGKAYGFSEAIEWINSQGE